MLTKRRTISRTALLSAVLCSGLPACSPYPDAGEFLAGVVFSTNFISGVKGLRTLPATGRNRGTAMPAPYTILASGGASAKAVATATPADSPLWTDAGKRDPLVVASAQPVYVFDNEKACSAPPDAVPFHPRWDLVDPARQYPIFADLPEVLTGMSGRAGRTGGYSAIVEIIHIQTPAGFPCQSIKRADTVKSRTDADLKPTPGAPKEYRLLLIVDPALTAPPLPFQLGWFNQLVVPYIDMGPVPLEAGGLRFATMPIYNVVPMGAAAPVLRVVPGALDDAPGGPPQSGVCRDYTLTVPSAMNLPPTDVTDPAYMAATATTTLSACVVCRTIENGKYLCPLSASRAGAR